VGADFKTGTNLAGKVLVSAQCTIAGNNTVYTEPALSAVKVSSAALCNTTGSTVTVSVSIVPSGGTVGVTNRVVNAYPLAANDSMVISEIAGALLDAGAVVSVNTSTANAVNIVMTGAVSS
jgi:hypothetical protein